MDKAVETLAAEYAVEIGAWDWDSMRKECESGAEVDPDNLDIRIGRCFLGTVFALMPSGKYYMPWTSNQTDWDIARDEVYMEALEAAADAAGGWIESGEWDSCDLFFGMSFYVPDNDNDDTDPFDESGEVA